MSGGSASSQTELPEGWQWSTVEKPIWEWRCPHGDKCGKNYRLMYKKSSWLEAITQGNWHLVDKEQHAEPEFTWEEAETISPEGITESTRQWTVVLNADGEEVASGGSLQRARVSWHRRRRLCVLL
jgi:hypothetical protein